MQEEEYIVINKSKILKRIEDLKAKIAYAEKEPFKGNIYGVESWEIQISVFEQILSNSIPLIPEIEKLQKLVDEGYDPYDSAHHLQVQRMLEVIENYIENLKLKI